MANNQIDLKYVVDYMQLRAANKELQKTDKNLSQTGTLASSSGKKMNKFGVAMQQTGYQVGDFLVQVQSGQNAMVAFGQQATQLVGILPMFNSFMGLSGTALVGLSAGLGIAIPLVTAVGAALMRSGASAKSFEKQVKETKNATEEYFKLLKANSSTFETVFGKAEESLRLTSQASKDLLAVAKIEAFDSITALNESLSKSVLSASYLKTELEDVGDLLGASFGEVVAANMGGKLGDQVNELYSSLYRLKEAGTLQEQYDVAVKIRDIFKSNVDVTGQMTDQQKVFWKELSTTILKMELLGAATDSLGSSFVRTSKSIKESIELYQKNQVAIEDRNQAVEDIKQTIQDESKTLEDQIRLNSLLLSHGKQSAEYKAEAARQEREQYRTQLLSEGVIGNNLKKQMKLYDANVDLLKKVAETEVSLDRLFRNRTIFYSIRFSGEQEVMSQSLTPSGKMKPSQSYEELIAMGWTPEDLERIGMTPPRKSPNGGGGASQQDPLAKLRERIKLDTELLGKTKERQEVERAIANSSVGYSQAAIDQAVAELEAYNQMVEKRQELQGIYDTAQSALEDGFMAMVEGTKSVEDAFKDMARSVIKELYDVLVVQRLVGSFDSNAGTGSGIMGFIGKAISSFDGGGYTGSGPRSGGMDGRGGYLAMLHPRETVVDHTKAGSAGGGEGVTVVQNFNFQANGDDSVKKIIAQAAPSIANMAKQSVMDARRRGGAMKNTFG